MKPEAQAKESKPEAQAKKLTAQRPPIPSLALQASINYRTGPCFAPPINRPKMSQRPHYKQLLIEVREIIGGVDLYEIARKLRSVFDDDQKLLFHEHDLETSHVRDHDA